MQPLRPIPARPTLAQDLGVYRPRWIIRRDLEQAAAIDRLSFTDSITADDLALMLRVKNCLGLVVDLDKSDGSSHVAAYAMYQVWTYSIQITRLAVRPFLRRRGLGAAIMKSFKAKMGRRCRILCDVPEDQLAGHLFLRAQGFRAIECLRDANPPAYRFEFELQPDKVQP